MDNKLKEIIDNHNKIVIFSGAGVSAESGYKTFRGDEDSIYQSDSDIMFSIFNRQIFNGGTHIDMMLDMFKDNGELPNKAHYLAKELEDLGKLQGVITQNVDRLYEKTGLSKDKLVHIHGVCDRIICKKCGKELDIKTLEKSNTGRYKSSCCKEAHADIDMVLYGDDFKREDYNKYSGWLRESDCLLVMGTGLDIGVHHDNILTYTKDKYLINKEDVKLNMGLPRWSYYSSPQETDWTDKFIGSFKDIL